MSNLRSKMIRLAASMPRDSTERKALLDVLAGQPKQAARRQDRSKALAWVEAKIRYLTDKQMPDDRMISSTARNLSQMAGGYIAFWTAKASEYEQDAKDFQGQGLSQHATNTTSLARSMRERVSRWEGVSGAVSNQYGELVRALGLAKQALQS